jgi:hypothetical protein
MIYTILTYLAVSGTQCSRSFTKSFTCLPFLDFPFTFRGLKASSKNTWTKKESVNYRINYKTFFALRHLKLVTYPIQKKGICTERKKNLCIIFFTFKIIYFLVVVPSLLCLFPCLVSPFPTLVHINSISNNNSFRM